MSNLCWIRRDLRLHDHAALSNSLDDGETTLVFIFDSTILGKLQNKADRRVTFIMESLAEIEKKLQSKGSSLIILHGDPAKEIPNLAQELKIKNVYCNKDYEPSAKKRDQEVSKKLASLGINFYQSKDSVFYEKNEILNGSGSMYKVFTPYKNKWIETFESQGKNVSDFECNLKNLKSFKNQKNILDYDWDSEIGFEKTPVLLTGGTANALKRLKAFEEIISEYKTARDYPSIEGTSLLSVYIRFGNLSIRDMIRSALKSNDEGSKTWLSEIIWRDFYQMLFDSHPELETQAFKPQYDKIEWLGSKNDFKAWCEGETGFPIIDASMRCFNATGMMHNRLRMVVASFLCKILLVDWRLGEKYFAENLLDFDLAANNGGWQWSSSSGCDAQPYFRIFNPYTQSEKFDANGDFIRLWCPELAHLNKKEIHRPAPLLAPDYPQAIVSYETNRVRCLQMYGRVN